MTAYEQIDGKYYEQGSDEFYQALEKHTAREYPTVPTEKVLVRHFWNVRQVLQEAVVKSGLRP